MIIMSGDTMTEHDEMLDRLAGHATTPSVRNALHACRAGHPLNNAFQWRDAWCLVAQNPRMFIDVSAADFGALRGLAASEPAIPSI